MAKEYRTHGTNLSWSTLGQWIAAAHRLDHRRLSSSRSAALKAHGSSLPREIINAEYEIDVIDQALALLKYGPPCLARPQKGYRADAPQTRIIEDLMNRRAVLEREAEITPGGNWIAVHGS